MFKSLSLKIKILVLIVLAVATYLIISSFSNFSNDNADAVTKDTKFYLNTSCTIQINGMDPKEASSIIDEAFNLCGSYENQLSRTVENSDIWKINHSEENATTSIHKETAHIIRESLKISKETEGSFDISVGQLSELWNFTSPAPSVPDDVKIKEALLTVDYRNIVLKNKNAVLLKNKESHIDLGAVAKGYIADKLVAFLEEKGVKSGIVNLGGNIVAIGTKGDRDWNIGIELPYSHQTDIIGSVEIKDKTIVTSGVFERFFEENGIEYHHIVDPKTGYPKDTDIVLVSIMSDKGNSMYCDLYSTTCLLLGKEKAMEFMKDKKGFEYCIVDTNNEITTSAGFKLEPKQ